MDNSIARKRISYFSGSIIHLYSFYTHRLQPFTRVPPCSLDRGEAWPYKQSGNLIRTISHVGEQCEKTVASHPCMFVNLLAPPAYLAPPRPVRHGADHQQKLVCLFVSHRGLESRPMHAFSC